MAGKGKVEVEIIGKDKASGVFNKVGGNMKKLGKIATGFGIAGAAGLFAITKAAADFEGKMREVNTMIGLSEEEFKDLSKQVQDTSKSVGKSSSELSSALYQIVSAGVDSAHAIEVLDVAAKAAVAGVTDVETAADGLTTVLNAFKIPASEAEHVADVLFTTVKGGKTTFEELSASMFNVAPIAATAGVKFETVAAALATMTKQGVPTSVATTQLRAAIQQIIKPTADMTKALDKLGYESGQALLAEKGFEAGINDLAGAAGGSLADLGKMFGSVEALSAILALTGENSKTFAADIAATMEASGAKMAAYDEINKGAARQFEILWNKIKTVGEELGAVLLPIVTGLIDKMGGVVDKVSEWIKVHPELTEKLVLFAGVLTGLTLVGGPLMMMSGQIKTIIGVATKFVSFIRISLIPSLIKLIATFIATLAAMGPAGWAMIGASVGIAAAGIIGLKKLLGGGGEGGLVHGPQPEKTFTPPESWNSVDATTRSKWIAHAQQTGWMAPEGWVGRPPGMETGPQGYQHGGIVPGPLGAPVPIIAHGGEAFLGVGNELGGDTYNFHFGNYLGERNELVTWMREALLKVKSRNVTTGL